MFKRKTGNIEEKICTVSTIKAPLKQTKRWINYHLNIGVDHMFIFFDDPEDPAIEELNDYKKVTCFRCDEKYWKDKISKDRYKNLIESKKFYGDSTSKNLAKKEKKYDLARVEKQKINSMIALDLAKKDGFKWIAHIDSDELIYTRGKIKKFLKNIPENLDFVKLPSLEAIPEKMDQEDVFLETKFFKNNFGKFSKKYFKAHIAGKSITRISKKIKHLGIHKPRAKEGDELKFKHPLIKGRLLHYDAPSFKDWKEKWLQRYRGQVIAVAMGKARRKLFEEFIKTYKKGEKELKKLYEKKYLANEPWKTLMRLTGIVIKIRIDKSLFKKTF